jgi:hypothetical protein
VAELRRVEPLRGGQARDPVLRVHRFGGGRAGRYGGSSSFSPLSAPLPLAVAAVVVVGAPRLSLLSSTPRDQVLGDAGEQSNRISRILAEERS